MKEYKLKPYSFPITDELKEALQKLAAADSRTLANYVRTVLERHAREQGTLAREEVEEAELAQV